MREKQFDSLGVEKLNSKKVIQSAVVMNMHDYVNLM